MKLKGIGKLLRQGRPKSKYYVATEQKIILGIVNNSYVLYRKAEGNKRRKRLGTFSLRNVAYSWKAAYERGALSDPFND